MIACFTDFIEQIPAELYQADKQKYPQMPSTDTNNLNQIKSFVPERAKYMDKYFDVNIADYKDLPKFSASLDLTKTKLAFHICRIPKRK